MAQTIILLCFLVAHIGTTVAIGLYLNRVARREVERAAQNVLASLAKSFLPAMAQNGNREKETV